MRALNVPLHLVMRRSWSQVYQNSLNVRLDVLAGSYMTWCLGDPSTFGLSVRL